ncbi:aldo/keto reductase [Rhodobacter lacus]|uniref:Aldo/keto reductase n=1 Tax=Rhodobacter lacus TaxID=1641972 RepID=A0ABW5A8Y9_9RHOB
MSSNQSVPVITAGGAAIPQIGLGTWHLHGEVVDGAVATAVAAGYRHFDTAAYYDNETDVGHALRATGLARDSYFLTTKVWYTELGRDALRKAAEASVERLGLGAVDLLLLHWPNPEIPLAETMKALCAAKRDGLAKHIGVSNFPISLLKQALALTSEPIVANQCECHPRLNQKPLKNFCDDNDIAFVAYSPIGSGKLTEHPVLSGIAATHGKTSAQVMLRWHLQRGNIAIPRSSKPERVCENIAVTDFALSAEEMGAIDEMNAPDGRMISPSWVKSWE